MKLKSFFLLFFSQTLLLASPHLPPCHFGFSGTLLYLYPNYENNFPVTFSEKTPKTRFEPAFRLEGIYAFSSVNDLHLRYTYFKSSDFRLKGTLPDFFSSQFLAKTKFNTSVAEVLAGRWLYEGEDFNLSFQAGALFAFIKNRIFQEASVILPDSTTAQTTQKTVSKYWGIGPELVLNFQYIIPYFSCGRLSFATDMRGALLANKKKFILEGLITQAIGKSREKSSGTTNWSVNPAADFKAGLNWLYPWNCFTTWVEVGYEWIFYHRALIGDIRSLDASIDTGGSISFNGPYFELGVTF